MNEKNGQKPAHETPDERGPERKAPEHSTHPETHKPGMAGDGRLPTKHSNGAETDNRTKHDPDANQEQQRTGKR
jgi:hypothetical protein